MADTAAAYPANHGSAEEIFLLQPDLVVAGIWSDPAAISLLRRLGIRVEQFELEDDLSDIAPQLARMGALLGRETEAQALIRRFETDLAALSAVDPTDNPRAAFYYPNGYTLGPGSLADDTITTAGFHNIIAELNRSASGQLALELLVLAAPDLIVTSQPYRGASQAEEILRHPALRSLIEAANTYQSGPDWVCGTPAILGPLRALRDLRDGMVP
jgi:iron complex transport system substrate-binding protein